MKAKRTFPPAIELGSTRSGRIFHAFHHLQGVPTPDLLRLERAREQDNGTARSRPVSDLLNRIDRELSRRREQSPQAG